MPHGMRLHKHIGYGKAEDWSLQTCIMHLDLLRWSLTLHCNSAWQQAAVAVFTIKVV
jgi:hypothetical protein